MNRSTRPSIALGLSLLAGAVLLATPAHAALYVYNCILNPRQEVPPVASSALGGGRFVIDTDANTVTFRIAYAGLSSAELVAHIHGDAGSSPGTGGPVIFSLPAGNPKVGVWNYDEAQEPLILGGLCYANIHSANFPGGEMRGQIVPFNALLDAAQEVPPTTSTGTGWAVATIDQTLKQLKYYVFFEGLTGAVTAGHFHGNSIIGTPAAVKVALAAPLTSPISGTVTYLAADETALLSGQWYVNLHTVANPGGEIRGQLVPRVIPIDADQEVLPSVSEPASAGFSLVCVDTVANKLGYDERVLSLSSAETFAHIHGFAWTNANAGVQLTEALGARKLGTWTYPVANEADVLGGRSYFNVHTTNHPGGEMRGQIVDLPVSPGVLGVVDQPRHVSGLAAAPNPFGGRTQLTFQLARTGRVSLRIVDVNGRSVRQLPDATYAPGAHSLEWDGHDDEGRAVSPGVYFAVVKTSEGEKITRVARLR